MFEPSRATDAAKDRCYQLLVARLCDLLHDERDFIANAANTASLIFHTLPGLNWAGFYLLRGGELVVGPFQGKPACTRIALGRGVCGRAAQTRQTIVVDDVHQFPGHIACDGASNAEIVVPLIYAGCLVGVLDLDSPEPGRFDAEDRAGLQRLVEALLERSEIGGG